MPLPILLLACHTLPGQAVASKGADALPRTCAEVSEDVASIQLIDPDGPGGEDPFRVTCEAGGWTLVLHLSLAAGLDEDDFLETFGHNRFTDETWTYEAGSLAIVAGLNGGLMSLLTQGAVDIARFEGLWTDVRMACSLADLDPMPDHFAQVDGYTTANGSSLLLGAAPNGTRYTVDPATNSMGLPTLSHDNEVETSNSQHYLCDNKNDDEYGAAPQFGFCYTSHLENVNAEDKGDSVVALSFGSGLGADSWSTGFSGECGDMAGDALHNAGTFWIWVR